MIYKKSESTIEGLPSTKKPMLKRQQRKTRRTLITKFSIMVILSNNYQPKANQNSPKTKWNVPNYYLNYIPISKKAYNIAQELKNIFEKTIDKIIGLSRLAKWHEKVSQSGFKSFNTISRSIINHS